MATDTLTGGSLAPPEPAEISTVVTEAEEAHFTLDDAFAITQMLKDHAPRSVTEGWEERARTVETGRIYKVEPAAEKALPLGTAAVRDVEVELYQHRDMPVRFKHTLGATGLGLYQQRPRFG